MNYCRSLTVMVAMICASHCAFAQPDLGVGRGHELDRLAATILDRSMGEAERDKALSALERLDFERAVELAPALLSEEGEGIRFRAAWVLASAGKPEGLATLRQLAEKRSGTLTLPIAALGRLRDPSSHQRLRELLERELSDEDKSRARPRAAALTDALADYADPADAALLARAVGMFMVGDADWIDVDRLGRTGGSEAIPLLEEIFTRRGKGWAVISAGLGLARCGSLKGKQYVSERLADNRCCRAPYGTPQDGLRDDPNGPKATSFILDHLGLPTDEGFVLDLINLISSSQYSETAKAQAWIALERIDSIKYRKEVLGLAWNNLQYDGAVRLIALSDAFSARSRLARADAAGTTKDWRKGAIALTRALNASEREKRLWKESKGYGF